MGKITTPRFDNANYYGQKIILWMYLHLPFTFNKYVTSNIYRVFEFATMKDITAEVISRANEDEEKALDEGRFV